jgi:hypothetical protein
VSLSKRFRDKSDHQEAEMGDSEQAQRSDPLQWLEGDEFIVAARKWQHGEYTGLTAARIYVRIDPHLSTSDPMSHIKPIDPTSEELAQWLADGTVKELDESASS